MAGQRRKRTPEEIRTIPTKATDRMGGRHHPQTPKGTTKPRVTGRRDKSRTSNESARTRGTSHATRTTHRVASPTKKSVMFTLDAPSGLDVSVAGSFNNWTPQAMTKGPDGLWRITVQLAHGTYQYKFLVDATWREDPNNPRKTQDESGGFNSICDVL